MGKADLNLTDYYETFTFSYDDLFPDEALPKLYEDAITTAKQVYLTMTVLFSLIDFVTLTAVFNKQAREKTPSWLCFYLTILVLLSALIIHPLRLSSIIDISQNACVAFMFTERLFLFLINFGIFFINLETICTMIMRKPSWQQNQRIRTAAFICGSWIFCSIALAYLVATPMQHCLHFSPAPAIILHILGNWLPGLTTLVTTITALVIFSVKKYHTPRDYDHFSETSRPLREARDWLVMLVILNSIYLITFTVMGELFIHGIYAKSVSTGFTVELMIHVVIGISPQMLPMAFLALPHFRSAIGQACWGGCRLVTRGKFPPTNVDHEEQVLNMDEITEQPV